MAGIFSETQETYTQHVFWSILIFISFFPVLILVNVSIITYPDFNKLVAYYGFGVSLIDLSFLVLLVFTGVDANVDNANTFELFNSPMISGLLNL